MKQQKFLLPILVFLFFVATGASCVRVSPPIPIATLGQNTLVEKQQIEATYAFGGNSSNPQGGSAAAHYGRLRYGILNNLNVAVDGIISHDEYRGIKLGLQYRPIKYIVIDGGFGKGYGDNINSTGSSFGLTFDLRLNKAETFGIYTSGRLAHNHAINLSENKVKSQRLACFGISGYVDDKKRFFWFSEMGLLSNHEGNFINQVQSTRDDYYFGMGLSYRFRLIRKAE